MGFSLSSSKKSLLPSRRLPSLCLTRCYSFLPLPLPVFDLPPLHLTVPALPLVCPLLLPPAPVWLFLVRSSALSKFSVLVSFCLLSLPCSSPLDSLCIVFISRLSPRPPKAAHYMFFAMSFSLNSSFFFSASSCSFASLSDQAQPIHLYNAYSFFFHIFLFFFSRFFFLSRRTSAETSPWGEGEIFTPLNWKPGNRGWCSRCLRYSTVA